MISLRINPKLWTVFEVFSFQMQAEAKYISWKGNMNTSLVQVCHWYLPFWMCIIFVNSGLPIRFPIVHKLSSMTGVHVAKQCKLVFSGYEGLILWYQITDHAILHKHLPVSCKPSVWIILQVLHITNSQMDLQWSMYRLLRACFTKLKKKVKIFTHVSWFIVIPPNR